MSSGREENPLIGICRNQVADSFIDQDLLDLLRAGAASAWTRGRVEQDSITAVRKSGLLGLVVPREHGGSGLDMSAANQVVERVATADPSVAIMLYLHTAVIARIVEFGGDELQAWWLPRVTEDGWLACSAWSEPGSTADKRTVATRALPGGDGTWRVDGEKNFATSATIADFFALLVQLPPSGHREPDGGYGGRDQAIFLVRGDSPGVEIPEQPMDLMGMRGSGTGMARFRDVTVPAEAVLCTGVDTGAAIRLPHRLGLTLGAVSVGVAQAAYQLAVDHAVRRELIEDPAIRRQLSRIAVDVESARAMVAALPAPDPEETTRLAYAVKVSASTTSQRVCEGVRELMGSAGYLRGHEINRVTHDADAVVHMGPPNHLCVDLLASQVCRQGIRGLVSVGDEAR